MTINEVKRYIKCDRVFDLEKDFYRHLKNYKEIPCEIVIQNPAKDDENDYVPMVGVVYDNELLAMYVAENLVTPAKIDLFFSENKIRRPHK